MLEPSEYELAAWDACNEFTGRRLSSTSQKASQGLVDQAVKVKDAVDRQLERHPRLLGAVQRSTKGASATTAAVAKAADKTKAVMPRWSGLAYGNIRSGLAKAARVGLSDESVVTKHQKAGHDVAALHEIRRLDLEQVDRVRSRGYSWYYPALAALSGAGAGLVMTGGELVVTAGAGASAAPGLATVVTAFAADASAVLALSSRAVGHVALMYGYDPELPTEKLFVMSVVNAGTAASAGAKTAAFRDVSRLTQQLVRNKAWAELSESMVARVATQFGKAFSLRVTRQGLGKLVPAAGMALGGTFNWATLEGVVDAADVAYRRRFLLEKYPQLADDDRPWSAGDDADDATPDVEISVLGEMHRVADDEGADVDPDVVRHPSSEQR